MCLFKGRPDWEGAQGREWKEGRAHRRPLGKGRSCLKVKSEGHCRREGLESKTKAFPWRLGWGRVLGKIRGFRTSFCIIQTGSYKILLLPLSRGALKLCWTRDYKEMSPNETWLVGFYFQFSLMLIFYHSFHLHINWFFFKFYFHVCPKTHAQQSCDQNQFLFLFH